MSEPFEASFAKLGRARHFIEELERLLEEHKQRGVVLTGPESYQDGAFRQPFNFDPPGLQAALVIGDAIHNMRTALDLMAAELVTLSGEDPKNVYFPFAEAEPEIRTQIKNRNFDKAGPDAVSLLLQFAPYKGGNAALRAIHDLDVQDKHKAIIPTATRGNIRMELRLDENGRYAGGFAGISLESLHYAFPSDSVFAGQEIVPTLKDSVEIVQRVLEAFAALVAARPS